MRLLRKDNVTWLRARSIEELAECLRAKRPTPRGGYGIRLKEGKRERHFVFAGTVFLALWQRAAEEGFSLGAVEKLFLATEAQRLEPGIRPRERAFVPQTGDIWVSDPTRSIAPAGEGALHRQSAPGFEESAMRPPMESAEEESLRRTPHLDLLPEGPLRPGDSFSIEVYCDCSPPGRGEDVEEISLTMPRGWRRAELDVWLVLPAQLECRERLGSVIVTAGEKESTRARFEVTVAGNAPPAAARLSAVFSFEGRPCGQVVRLATVGEPDETPPLRRPSRRAGIVVVPGQAAADLTIRIKSVDDGEQEFECRVSTSLLPGGMNSPPTRWRVPRRAPELVQGYMEGFSEEGLSDGERISRLLGAGMELWRAAPEAVRDLFWELVDKGKPPGSIFIVTDEWSFPWELVVPVRGYRPAREQREPWGVECAVGRWVDEEMLSPPQSLEIRESYVLAPNYPPEKALTHSSEEAEYVCKHLNGKEIEPAVFEALEDSFAAQPVSLAHFACHGETTEAEVQCLSLEEGKSLRADQIEGMEGLAKAVWKEKSLVFLNACEAGRPLPALVGVGGFASAFIGIGAGAVIAPLWSVDDEVAHSFALEVYGEVGSEGGAEPAAVLRGLRQRAYAAEGADSWAAYSFYGDPLTRVMARKQD